MNTPILILVALASVSQSSRYDPLATSGAVKVADTEFSYGSKKRLVPLRVYLPATRGAGPVIMFSHGLGGSRENNKYVASHWASRGYVVVAIQHKGSDGDVMKDAPRGRKLAALAKAANARATLDRLQDVKEVLNYLEKQNKPGGKFAKRMDLDHVGMSGHSFGAITTQGVSGQSFGRRGQIHTDKRIKAALAFSPSPPNFGHNKDTFGNVKVPWMLMTGSKDKSMIARTTPEQRREVFRELPRSGHHYELVLDGAEHMSFSDRPLLAREHRNPKHHVAIKAISTGFFDAYLKNDRAAKAWLDGSGPRSVLVKSDRWRRK